MLTKKHKKYWVSRQKKLISQTDRMADKTLIELNKYYSKTLTDIERDIAAFNLKYGADNVLEYQKLLQRLDPQDLDLLYRNFDGLIAKYPSLARFSPLRDSFYKFSRLDGLQADIMMKMLELGAYEDDAVRKHLLNVYGHSYEQQIKNLSRYQKLGSSVHSVDQEALKIINQAWTGTKNYSQRVWDNIDKLNNYLNNEFKDGVIKGKPVKEIAKDMRDKVGGSKYSTERLVRTETAYVQEQATLNSYSDMGVTEYQILAVLDERTSQTCISLDGKIFKITEAVVGYSYPPFHPMCRTTTIPVIESIDYKKIRW